MALLDEVETFLVNEGLAGGATGWSIGKNWMAATPDKFISIYETGGESPEMGPEGSGEVLLEVPTFMIMGRIGVDDGYGELRSKMGSIANALHDGDLGVNYTQVRALASGPMPVGLDANGRPQMTWNFEAVRDRD